VSFRTGNSGAICPPLSCASTTSVKDGVVSKSSVRTRYSWPVVDEIENVCGLLSPEVILYRRLLCGGRSASVATMGVPTPEFNSNVSSTDISIDSLCKLWCIIIDGRDGDWYGNGI